MAGSTAFQRSKGKPYAETFRCPGGALCLDFCNSGGSARRASGTEWIAGFADLVDWLEAAEAVTGGQAARLRRAGAASPRAAAQVWARAIKFRETLFRVLNAKAFRRLEHAKLQLGYAYHLAGQNQKAIQVLKTVQGTDGAAALARLWVIRLSRAS